MKPPRIICGHCGGRGRVQLQSHLQAVLALLETGGPGIGAPWLAWKLGIKKQTAMNQRLERLRVLGLARRGPREMPVRWWAK